MRSHSSPKIPPLSETSEIPNVFRHPNSLSPSVRFPTSPSPPRWPCWRWAPPAASSAGGRGDADWRGDAKGELTCLERIKKYRSHIGSPTAGRANFSKATRNVQPGRPAVGPYPATPTRPHYFANRSSVLDDKNLFKRRHGVSRRGAGLKAQFPASKSGNDVGEHQGKFGQGILNSGH